MLHVVLKDVNPIKVTDFHLFLKEINDVIFMLTLGKAPLLSGKLITDPASPTFTVIDGDFSATFQGEIANQSVVGAKINLVHKKNALLEIAYSIAVNQSIDMRIFINAEAEKLAYAELERAFKNDFSSNTISLIQSDLIDSTSTSRTSESLNETVLQPKNETSEQGVQHDSVSLIAVNENNVAIEEDLAKLSDNIMQAIGEVKEMIFLLNNLCHDITRGSAPNLVDIELKEQLIDNGATIQLFDAEENSYKTTFRKGSLDAMSEVSFFLEKDNVLIFSVYFSSLGNGKIVAGGRQADFILTRIKEGLN